MRPVATLIRRNILIHRYSIRAHAMLLGRSMNSGLWVIMIVKHLNFICIQVWDYPYCNVFSLTFYIWRNYVVLDIEMCNGHSNGHLHFIYDRWSLTTCHASLALAFMSDGISKYTTVVLITNEEAMWLLVLKALVS